MQRIETRTQLIEFICEHISQKAIARACHYSEGSVQVMGGFSRIPPSSRPGWIVSVTSEHERTWLVAVTSDDHEHIFRAWVVESIPWQHYVGKIESEYSIYNGDNPQQACLAREKANESNISE